MNEITDARRDAIKEATKFNTELIRIFALFVIGLATGVSSLMFHYLFTGSAIKKDEFKDFLFNVLIVGGLSVLLIFIAIIFVLVSRNNKNLEILKK